MRRRTNVPSPVDSLVTQVEQLQQTDSTVEDGEIVWCRSTQCLWVYRVNSGLTPDGTEVVASLYGNGVWVRSNLTLGSAGDLLQTAWFIDPTNGSDANTGRTSSTALKTDTERQRRWGGVTRIVAPTTVTYLGSPPEQTFFNCLLMLNATLTLQGTSLVAKSGTFSAVTTLNRATQTPWSVTGTALGAADVGKIIQISGGARSGNYARIVKDNGANNVRTSPFGALSIPTFGFPQVTPAAPDPFNVLDLPLLNVGTWRFAGSSGVFSSNYVLVDSLRLAGASGFGAILADGGGIVNYSRSILSTLTCGGEAASHFAAGSGMDNVVIGANVFAIAVGVTGSGVAVAQRGVFNADSDTIFQNAPAIVRPGGVFEGGLVALFDRGVASTALLVDSDGAYRSRLVLTGSDLIWGDGNAGVGVAVRSGGQVTYVTKPTVNTPQGAGRQSLIGGTNRDWAVVPFVEPANNAMIVVYA